jgi:hypothetical protein
MLGTLSFIVVRVLAAALLVAVAFGFMVWFQYTPHTPDSGTIIVNNIRKDGNCSVGYVRPDGTKGPADVWIEDCPAAETGRFCTFKLSYTRIAYDIQCKDK